jgi:hypothetical protein
VINYPGVTYVGQDVNYYYIFYLDISGVGYYQPVIGIPALDGTTAQAVAGV